MRRATLRLSLRCDNRCVFCAQRGLDGPDASLDALAQLRESSDEITFTGGEPLLFPSLAQAIAKARAIGFRRVGVQTNGRALAELAPSLAQAGLTDVHVSLHGARAEVHDYHTGVDGSFAALLSGIARARALDLDIAATTVLTRSNFRVIGELPSLLAARGVSAWLIAIPRVAGEAALAFDRVVPRLGLALPFALHALDAAARLGLPAFIQGAPACALGPFATRAIADQPRTYGAVCESCSARSSCPGVDAGYLERFGESELQACAAVASVDFPSLFVGAGELAAAVAPARTHALPLQGKPRPAAREVAPSSPRKSGEALRELFPALFEKP